jgi:hypothetical protein
MTDGDKCHAIALRDKPYCYYHMRLHRNMHADNKPSKAKEKTFEFAFPDSRTAIQLALYQVLSALGSSKIDLKRATAIIYNLQIASQNVPRSVETIPSLPVVCVSETPDGDEVGPDCMSFELPGSCADCTSQDQGCPMCDESELRMLAIAHGVDKDEEQPQTLPQMLKKEIMRQLHGGVMPEARDRIHALMSEKEAETKS